MWEAAKAQLCSAAGQQDREGDGEQVVEAAVVAVALRHPGLLGSFLRAEQRPGSQRALRRAHAKDVGTAQLLRRLLSSTASGQQPRLAAGLDGAARPYLQRYQCCLLPVTGL